MEGWRARFGAERGFTLIEVITATAILAVGIILTLTPVVSASRVIQASRNITIAQNLAQARIEEIRSVPYQDIGFPGSSPPGILSETSTVTLQGVTFTILTDVDFVGSTTGLDIIPQGGDGVEGAWDPGVDYKHVTIEVQHPTGAIPEVIMATLIAPPNLAAHEGYANVIVTLERHEPVGTPSSTALPRLYLVGDTGSPSTMSDAGAHPDDPDTQAWPATNPVASPNTEYLVRAGVGLTDLQADGWRIYQPDIYASTDALAPRPTETVERTLRMYRPATVTVNVDSGLGAVSGALVHLRSLDDPELHYESATTSSTGQVVFTTFDGAPLVPGLYAFTVSRQGALPLVASNVSVPSAYPTPDHTQDFTVSGGSAAVRFRVGDSMSTPRRIHDAFVTISGNCIPSRVTVPTNTAGEVLVGLLPGQSCNYQMSSRWGHAGLSGSFTTDSVSGTQTVTRLLATSATKGLIAFNEQAWPAGMFGLAAEGSGDDYTVVWPNNTGIASAAVDPNTYTVVKRCQDGTLASEGTITIDAGETLSWGTGEPSCP